MDSATYIEQLYDLGRYLWRQVEFPDLSEYYIFIFGGIVFLVILIVISKVIAKRKAVSEYLEDGICLKVDFPAMCNKEELLMDLLVNFHKDLYSLFKNKCYFSTEILIKEGKDSFFIFLPRDTYKHGIGFLSKNFAVEIVTDLRETFLEKLGSEVVAMELELTKDFVFPLILKKGRGKTLVEGLQNGEWFFLQVLSRPVGDRWLQILDRYIRDLEQGKNPSLQIGGCSGGCLGVTFPFLSFLADVLTSSIHGSGTKRVRSQKGQLTEFQRKRLEIVRAKKDSIGFEVLCRACVFAPVKDRAYLILDKFLSLVSQEQGEVNSFGVVKLHDKLKGDFRNDLLLANMGKAAVDVLTAKEVASLIGQFL